MPGIGAKTAARIIADLKGKIKPDDILAEVTSVKSDSGSPAINSIKKEALDIVCALGMSSSDAMRAINSLPIDENTKPEDLAFKAFQQL